MPRPENVGILAIEVYIPPFYVSQSELEKFDGVAAGKYTLGLGQESIAFTGDREDVNSLALTCVSNLLQKYQVHPSEIGRLEVGTETLIDKSKSTKTVLMDLFMPFGNHEIEGASTVNACYGGTAALFNAVDWVESSAWDGRFAIVVMPEIAIYSKGPARPTSGCGAVSLLIGHNAPLVLDSRTRTTFSENIYDFYKPDPSTEYPIVDGPTSSLWYLKALDACYMRFLSKQTGDLNLNSFQHVAFHSPYHKLVLKSFARLYYLDYRHANEKDEASPLAQWKDSSLESTLDDRELDLAARACADELFQKLVEPSTGSSKQVGNSYTASLYLNLATLVSSINGAGKILLFSYGSGCIASMYQLFIRPNCNARFDIERMKKNLDLVQRLKNRIKKTPIEFQAHLEWRETFFGQKNRKPMQAIEDLYDGTYYLERIDDRFKRIYACVRAAKEVAGPKVPRALACDQGIYVTGLGAKLPGSSEDVYTSEGALTALLNGRNCIEKLDEAAIRSMLEKNVSQCNSSERIASTEDSIKVAAKLRLSPAFDLIKSYGISEKLVKCMDLATRVAVAAGLDALRAAKLVQGQSDSTFSWRLADDIRDSFGVIYASSYPGMHAVMKEIERFHDLKEEYTYDRKFLFQILVLANAQLAQIIGARGPNTQVNAACAGATQAVSMAQDWIRMGHCNRVIIISSDVASSDVMMHWIGCGFRALGAASIASSAQEAALPFDKRRNGMILGAGAVALVLETQSISQNPLHNVRLLASQVSNSAYHGASLDVLHIAQELKRFLSRLEREYGITREEFVKNGVYYSHETFTHASPKTSCAYIEIQALRSALGSQELLSQLMITNVKGCVGHAMAASFEDVAAVEGLRRQILCPVQNYTEHDSNLNPTPLRLARGGHHAHSYALRFAAGFGSQIAYIAYAKDTGKF